MTVNPAKQALQQAIESTQQTIYLRTVRYRNLVILTSLSALVFLLWALIQFSWRPLLGLLVLIPYYGIFVYLDNRLLGHWQEALLQSWQEQTLDLQTFTQVIEGFRHLPENTLKSMLDMLPSNSISDADKLPQVMRKALGATLKTINRFQGLQALFPTLVSSMLLVSLSIATLQWHRLPLTGLLLIPVLMIVKTILARRILKQWKNHIGKLYAEGLVMEGFIVLAGQLDWQAVSEDEKRKLLKTDYLLEK